MGDRRSVEEGTEGSVRRERLERMAGLRSLGRSMLRRLSALLSAQAPAHRWSLQCHCAHCSRTHSRFTRYNGTTTVRHTHTAHTGTVRR